MDAKLASMGVNSETEFNTILFEKKLTGLKDSQDSINSCCHWCLQNRQHHKKIVSCWLNVLKRVKIEHRLTLFYLANDVIQYSKRRNYDFVESWGTTLQKATTMVRDEKVKKKILRIFKIWEQRGIYGEEFITDLCGLISASPSARKGDETHEFQSSYLIQKVRACARLEVDTDCKLRQLKEHNPKIQIDSESVISSLKDRAHVDDVEKELDDYTKQMENYINALKSEIKARIHLISLLTQAETQLENDKKDVKLVVTAYRTFATRVKTLKKKLDEKLPTLASPIPSPDINAPSPSPDSDIELPGNENNSAAVTSTVNAFNNVAALYTNAGYYNPVPPPTPDSNSSFNSSNFSSFIGSNMPFSLENLNSSSLFGNNQSQNTTASATSQTQTTNSYSINNAISSLFPSMACPPPPPAPSVSSSEPQATDYEYGNSHHVPLMPPPMPPFSKADDTYGVPYGDTYNGSSNSNYANPTYEPTTAPYQPDPQTYQTSTATFPPATSTFPPPTTTFQTPATSLQPPTTSFEAYSSNYPPSIPAPPYQNPEPQAQVNYATSAIPLTNPYPIAEEYNPEEDLETWESEPTWEPPPPVDLDTPESPPLFEKEGYGDPIEYHDASVFEGAEDVDHRVLPALVADSVASDSELGHRLKDVDHRNLISLTGSPSESRPIWTSQGDQDYRKPLNTGRGNLDQDYRVPFNIENLKLPPPPPPPKMLTNQNLDSNLFNISMSNPFNPDVSVEEPALNNQVPMETPTSPTVNKNFETATQNTSPTKSTQPKRLGLSPRKLQDNTESIDMDLSDDDDQEADMQNIVEKDVNININAINTSPGSDCFELPPPFPDLMDDVDANNFLDKVNENLDLGDLELEAMDQPPPNMKHGMLGHTPLPPFPPNFANPPAPGMFNTPPPPVDAPVELPTEWADQGYNREFHMEEFQNPEFPAEEFQNREFPFRGRGGNLRGNFSNRGMPRTRNNWVGRGNHEFRGRGRGPPRNMRGGMLFRGNRGGPGGPRGNWMPRGRGGRGRGDHRGRGDFRGNFRGGF